MVSGTISSSVNGINVFDVDCCVVEIYVDNIVLIVVYANANKNIITVVNVTFFRFFLFTIRFIFPKCGETNSKVSSSINVPIVNNKSKSEKIKGGICIF